MPAAEYDPRIRLVDVTAEAREAFGDEALRHLAAVTGASTGPSWRFEVDTPTGGTMTFNHTATAEYVAQVVAELKTEKARG